MATEIETPHGLARVHLHAAADPRAALVLGHGAGGGVTAPDLTLATEVALEEDITVALVEQPYRVAGRRSPAPAATAGHRVAHGARAPARERARRPPADHRGTLARRAGGVPDGEGDRSRGGSVPRLPRPSARSPGEVAPGRARRGGGSRARGSGRERSVRHASGRVGARGRPRQGRSQPSGRPRRDRGRGQILAPRRASSANARPMTMPIKLLETRSKATVSPSKSTALSISKAVGVTITTSQKYPRSRSA